MSELLEALRAVQAQTPTLIKDRTAKVRTKAGGEYSYSYISLDTIVEVVGPILAEHGLVWITRPIRDPADGTLLLDYALTHTSGESITGAIPLLMAERTAQAMGSAITYARRYALSSVLNLVADEDDDGQHAQAKSKVRPPAVTAPGATESFTDPGKVLRDRLKTVIREAMDAGLTAPLLRGAMDDIGAHEVELKAGWMDQLDDTQVGALIDKVSPVLGLDELPAA